MLEKQTGITNADAVQNETTTGLATPQADAPTIQTKKRRRVPAPSTENAEATTSSTEEAAPSPEASKGLPQQFTQAVQRLAALPAVEFERCRKAEADALSVRVAMLTEHVERQRREVAMAQQTQQHALTLLSGAVTATVGRKTMEFGNGRYEVSDKDGVWFIALDAETGAERRTWICSTLHLVARTRDENSVFLGCVAALERPLRCAA